jgi:hypothetical protein
MKSEVYILPPFVKPTINFTVNEQEKNIPRSSGFSSVQFVPSCRVTFVTPFFRVFSIDFYVPHIYILGVCTVPVPVYIYSVQYLYFIYTGIYRYTGILLVLYRYEVQVLEYIFFYKKTYGESRIPSNR